jgi:hypothetical protein
MSLGDKTFLRIKKHQNGIIIWHNSSVGVQILSFSQIQLKYNATLLIKQRMYME